jgi:breast cancer 2 susceptibility protein
MILWKLAGQIQAKPSLYKEKWNWTEVIRQLKYR